MGTTLERARRLVQQVGTARNGDDFARIVVDGLWDLIPNDEVTFNDIDVDARRFVVCRTRSILPVADRASDGEAFDERYRDYPYCRGLAPGAPGVVRMSDAVSRAELERFTSYQEVMRPDGIDFAVTLSFASPPSIRRAVIMVRTDRDFTDRECDLLTLMAPHLEAGYRRIRAAGVLTRRELEVLSLVREGFTNREIARRLDISAGTVRAHPEHAFAKLGVGTRTAAVAAVS